MPRKNQIPSYLHHKKTGQAFVKLNGRFHYLGEWGSESSKVEYERLITQWLANGRVLPDREPISVGEILLAYIDFAKGYYRKNGELSKEFAAMKDALRPVRRLFAHSLAQDFGPLSLKAVQERMVADGLARTTVNNRIARVKRVFKWATERELVPPSVFHGLQSVAGLRRGRTRAPEPEPIRPVAFEHVEAVIPHVSPPVAAMIRLQWLTGMRPGEVVLMRGDDIDQSGSVWVYRPARHKTEHHGIERCVALGPKAQAILIPWLGRLPDDEYLFSPKEAATWASERKRRRPSAGKRKQSRRQRRSPGAHYTTESYDRAVSRVCQRFGIPRWTPNQLRHSCDRATSFL